MNIVKVTNLACPIDGHRLEQQNKQLICSDGHSFDIARQGYVNLLPVQHKRSKQPGDSKAMVVARAEFLNTGIYQPIADKLIALVSASISDDKDICLLDAGCGEGYYFDKLIKALVELPGANNLSFIGLDISKDAVMQATKRNRQVSWIVGTNRKPPVEEKSVDIILCMFGFFSIEGFTQVLKPGGILILIDPGTEHLKELRAVIYTEQKKAEDKKVKNAELTGFDLVSSETLNFKSQVSGNERIRQLLVMTPHFYRASKAGRESACALNELAITVDVVFSVYVKT